MRNCKNCKMTDEYCASGDCPNDTLTERWINIYKSKEHGSYWTGTFGYKTKEEAVKDLADKKHYLTTVNIEDMLNLQTQNTKLKGLLKLNNSLNKGSKAIYAWLKEDTAGEQKKLCTDLFDATVEMMSEINQIIGEE